MYRLLTPIILVFFVLSGLSLPNEQQQGDDIDLRRVIEKVQSFSEQTDAGIMGFAQSFRSTVTVLKVVAGLKTVIVKKPSKNGADTTTVIVYINLPYLPATTTDLDINISSSDLNIPNRLVIDTSVILSVNTPPPIV